MVITRPGPTGPGHTEHPDPPHVREEVRRARQEERLRLSAEIHDGAVQWLVGALYSVKACRSQAGTGAGLEQELINIQSSLTRGLSELRRLISELRPLPLEETGLVAAIREKAARLQGAGIDCHLDVIGVLPQLTSSEEQAVFGVVQEAMANARTHARASRIDVRLLCGETIHAEVVDNGRGFVLPAALDNCDRPEHIGLSLMRDRARALRARLDVKSQPGRGTAVSLTFRPMPRRTVCRRNPRPYHGGKRVPNPRAPRR